MVLLEHGRAFRTLEITQSLSPRQHEVLAYVAKGSPTLEAAEKIGISHQTFKNHCTEIYRKLGANDGLHAALNGIASGALSLAELVQGFDLSLFDRLSEEERNLLRTVLDENGANSTNKQLARRLGLSDRIVKNHLTSIYHKLEIPKDPSERKRVRAGVLFFASQNGNHNGAVEELDK